MTGTATRIAFSAVADMEGDIIAVSQVATLLRIIAESASQLDPEALNPLAGVLQGMGDRLYEQFCEAFQALKVQP